MFITSETLARLPVLSPALRFFLPVSSAWRLLGVAGLTFSEFYKVTGCGYSALSSSLPSSFFLPTLVCCWNGKP